MNVRGPHAHGAPATVDARLASNSDSERTCVGCRRGAPRGALARLALRDGEVVLWGPGRARPAGRGASLHPDAACLRAALKTGAFGRAFRGQARFRDDEAEFLMQLTAATAASREDRKSQ